MAYEEQAYWSARYAAGIGSGAGSRGAELLWKVGVIQSLIDEGCSSVLDLGCGDGAVAKKVLETRPDVQYLGVDIAQAPEWPEEIPFLLADVAVDELPTADLVLCLDVLLHISSEERHRQVVQRICDSFTMKALVTGFSGLKDALLAPHVFCRPVQWPDSAHVEASGQVPQQDEKTYFILRQSSVNVSTK